MSVKVEEFKNKMDIKPKDLYYSLKTEAELNEDISDKELMYKAYEFLEKHAKTQFSKKILKELKKEVK